ncbi:hypothetical protein NBE98_04285 [Clostridium swellfunianum]|uniref:hypothetical protein n=1 Tax=Clostridium swellfunianum TaxID=1367462 RepID=UPI00202E6522|nr:hypothetical protein [Clostridium swellfunianum]MCM0647598.1 hypothetical protein [Clostridium swellfunianum]
MDNLKNITLEISLKPFKQTDDKSIEAVCRKAFSQWSKLLDHANMVSILLWISDGSEILDYKADLNEQFEWARYIGGANPRTSWDKERDPEGKGLHTTYYLYTENPAIFTYGILKKVIETFKRVGHEVTGKTTRVGATFDPGPEFAKSDFKYNRHEEILLGDTMGKKSFVCCYSVLHADKCHYAGFPFGIPEGTPFGKFFGRQCQNFLTDMGFDYLWLSNGFGFGTETWGTTGAIFDGEKFYPEKMEETQQKIIEFWELFRKECPKFPVETRGTNLSAGIDLATDGVNLKNIYDGGYNILPPPNSPWAALDGDFGLELCGYMSRIAELPAGDDFLYRFYVHDPWWMNSPWIDRYEGQPHDIYLPLAVSRLNEQGEIKNPNHLNFLTIDTSLGEMPDQCPNEIIPHILKAYNNQPDDVSPFVWVYPFREYYENASPNEAKVEKPFFEDWFIRGSINNGLPISTVVSTDNFISSLSVSVDLFAGSVIITPVPEKDSKLEKVLISFIQNGGKVILYGGIDKAGKKLLEALNLQRIVSIDGILDLKLNLLSDDMESSAYPIKINHIKLMSDGGIDTVLNNELDSCTKVLAEVQDNKENRVVALYRNCDEWNNGAVAWIRGTSSNNYVKGSFLLLPHNPEEYYPMEILMRLALQEFGFNIGLIKDGPYVKSPVTMLHRHNNGFYFSGYIPNTTVRMKMKFPLGAPLLMGSETKLTSGHSVYSMPRAWQAECRVFVEQEEDTMLFCKEYTPVSYQMRRRIQVCGLKKATVRIFPEKGFEESTELLLNSSHPYMVTEKIEIHKKNTPWGIVLEAINITGELMISTPFN